MSERRSGDTTYPISKQLNMHFSPYEDRLVVRARRADDTEISMLLTRRMVMLVLRQLLGKLPELTGLEKTPAKYWQEVLQMAHQEAMEAKATTDKAMAEQVQKQKADAGQPPASAPGDAAPEPSETAPPVPDNLYLATELTVQTAGEKLTMAFKGLAMPDAMVKPSRHEPIFAIPLQVENVHQLIEMLIAKCQKAQWHLPVELPWLDAPDAGDIGGENGKYSLQHH